MQLLSHVKQCQQINQPTIINELTDSKMMQVNQQYRKICLHQNM